MNWFNLALLIILVWIIVGYIWLYVVYKFFERELKWYDKLLIIPAVLILLIIIG